MASPDGLIFFAVPEEAGPFRQAWKDSGRPPFGRLKIPGAPRWREGSVEVCVTGMGRQNAHRVASRRLAEDPAAWVVTAGFAGGLHPDWPRGTVGFAADPAFPGAQLLESADARPATFHEALRVVVTPEEKAALHRQTGADAVEMESATIRALCQERGIPSATVRVISDAASDTLPLDFGALMTPDDQLDFARLAWALVRSPGTIPELIRFQRQVQAAARALARVLITLVAR